RANTLFIGRLPPGPVWREKPSDASGKANPSDSKNSHDAADATDVAVGPQIIDWNRSHPLLANVELGNVDIADSLVLHPPPGATVLIDSTAGTIAAVAPRDAYQDAVLGFEIVGQQANGNKTVNTNWPRRLSFPTFCLNLLEYLGSGTEDSQIASTRPGRPVELRPVGKAEELTITDPIGRKFAVHRREGDIFRIQDTNLPGVYEVEQGQKVIERFAVNLFDRQESDVRVRPSQNESASTVRPADIRIGNIDVRATVGPTPTRIEAWKAVLACALFVLILEWYIYNRRVYL
ncbi:MAG TPA: hypothetical protein VHE81_18715, partial [Lacipirellulaceae bacterium]|nr:hypothetical protein [Lacipirellulaceae bacterium]